LPFTFRTDTEIADLVVITPRVFPDERGFFLESYKETDFLTSGVNYRFIQDNHSKSSKGVLRGLHYQLPPHAQGKLVRVVQGRVWDVAVDIRRSSPTFGKWYGIELSDENNLMFFIPPGFAHGFVTLENDTHFIYKCTAEYNKASDSGIRWDDPELNIEWPIEDVLVSPKDRELPSFSTAELFL
jgi:dTDP-4-dehydrorhamnose 3,5-epimerase